MDNRKRQNSKQEKAKENEPAEVITNAAPVAMASLMFVQFFSRIIHFVMNLMILRYMTPEDYGITALQLPFVATAIPRLIREALHRAAVRKSDDHDQTLLMVWWSIPIGALLSGILGFVFLTFSSTVSENPWTVRGFWCWLISSWLEMAIEPVIIHSESTLAMKVIVVVECLALLAQCGGTLIMLFTMESLVLLQSYGQLIFTVSLFVGYYSYVILWSIWKDLLPQSRRVTIKSLSSLQGFLIQAAGKYVTAEGEHFILFFFGTAEQQGIYEFVHNLGSMVARIAFQSIERTGFIYFAKLSKQPIEREKVWKMLLNISFMISLVYLSTCPNYIYFLVNTVYGDKWRNTSAPTLVAFYGIYLLLIGINGLVESLRDAISPTQRIQQMASFTIFTIVLYFATGALFMHYYGAGGLIFAACVSTIIRTSFNVSFFKEYLFSIMGGSPSADSLFVYFLLFTTGAAVRFYLGDTWKLLGFGVVQGVFFLAWLAFFQRKKLLDTWKLIRSRRG